MIQNYESRINKFVLKMAENPLIIKKSDEKYATSREEFLAKSSKNILDKKGFVFKSYKTDRERINQIIKDKNDLDKYISKADKPKQKVIDWGENKLVQPSMRFTARCDLERVYDVLKERELLFSEQKIVNAQMTKMGFASHNIEDYEEESDSAANNNKDINKDENIINEYKHMSEEEKIKKLRHNKIIQDRKMMLRRRNLHLGVSTDIKKKRENENNNQNGNPTHFAKQIREELYRRTHFKAMENLTMFKTSTVDHNLFKKWSKDDKKHQKKLKKDKRLFYLNISKQFKNSLKESKAKSIKKYKNKNHKNINNDKDLDLNEFSEDSGIGWGENKKIFKDIEINRELMASNPLLYNLNFHSLKSEEKNYDAICKSNIKTLKKIAFEKDNSHEDSLAEYEGLGGEDLKKEENIIIDGKYYKKSDTDLIADKLLTKCNWNEKKNKYHIQFGNGKLMFTSGLTLKEFQTKYGIFS